MVMIVVVLREVLYDVSSKGLASFRCPTLPPRWTDDPPADDRFAWVG